MRLDPLHRARRVAAIAAATVLLSGCASGFGLATDAGQPPPRGAGTGTEEGSASPSGTGAGAGTATTGAGAATAPPAAADPGAVPGAERFGVTAADDFCGVAPKVAGGFVGIFDAVYSAQAPGLQAQVDDALVAVDVLRSVAPDQTRADLDASRLFLSRFREVLAASGWDLAAAAAAHPEFFGGEADVGFAAMTAVIESIAQQCGLTP